MLRRRFYFDYAASTPVHSEVEKAMRPYFLKKFGNAGSLHSFGQEAVAALDQSRETIAAAIGAEFREIIFTGSATESNNIALRGLTRTVRGLTQTNFRASQRKVSVGLRPKLIVSAIEHESVLETARDVEKDGVEVVYLPVDRNGIVKLDELKSALDERTILISVMYANNEIGSIQPIVEISKLINSFRQEKVFFPETSQPSEHGLRFLQYPLLHTDAVQAFQFLDCDIHRLGVDLMTLSGHKIYGPKGVGALYIRNMGNATRKMDRKNFMSHVAPPVSPILAGGNQEFGIRSGTENIPLIVGFAKAVELLFARSRKSERERIAKLRDSFWNGLKKIYPRAERNGDTVQTTPSILNIYFPDYEAQHLLTKFDLAGIAVSAGSACSARSAAPSYVITALGYSERRAKQSIRFSFGMPTTQNDIDSALKVIRKLL